jgi:signal transduction histidine kinase/ABC-type amino acid transport substrate-binding protein
MRPGHIMKSFRIGLIFLALSLPTDVWGDIDLRVGVFQNPPLTFVDKQGKAQGMFVDILREVADRENWTLQFFQGSFAENLKHIRQGKIDIIAGLSPTTGRKEFIDFTQSELITTWAQAYVRPGTKLESITDLDGKRIGILGKGVSIKILADMCKGFDAQCSILAMTDNDATIAALINGKIDVGVVANVYGNLRELDADIQRTPIMFNPFKMHFGIRKSGDPVVMMTLDRYLSQWKADPASHYYRAFDKWVGKEVVAAEIPRWVLWLLFGLGTAIAIGLIWTISLKRQVLARTSDLADREGKYRKLNEELEERVDDRTKALRQNEETLLFVSQRSWEKSGEAFFQSLVNFLGKSLNVDYAFVDVLLPDGKTARTVSLYAIGQNPDNFEYDLKYTPCDNVIGKSVCCYPERIQQMFPKDELLVDMDAESYAGIPLWDSKREPIGLIAVMDRKPLIDQERIITVLQLVAVRAAHELERTRFDAAMFSAKEDADKANEAKSQFLANMSHELRTPLNAIIGYSEMLKEKTFGPLGDDKNIEYVSDINSAGTHLLSLINDVLDLSKIDAGKEEVSAQETDITAVLSGCVEMLKVLAVERHIEVHQDIPNFFPTIRVDSRHLSQVFINLLSNAIKFTPDGGSVDVKAAVEKDHSVTIKVIDTGVGISAEELPKVMEEFERAGEVLTRSQPGTGLGLPLTKKLAELNGGTVTLESEVGRGTTVTVRFPN